MKNDNYIEVEMDTSRFGYAKEFLYRVPAEIRGKVKTGSIIRVVDGDVKPFLCRITEMLDNGKSAYYECLEKSDLAAHA